MSPIVTTLVSGPGTPDEVGKKEAQAARALRPPIVHRHRTRCWAFPEVDAAVGPKAAKKIAVFVRAQHLPNRVS
ncbi:MAG: hypothetical protein WAS73_00460 [Defluviicoccus sp.]